MRTAVLSPGRRSRLGLERQPRLRGPRWLSAERLDAVAQTRSWVWPLLSAAVALVSATALAAVQQQIDLTPHERDGWVHHGRAAEDRRPGPPPS